MKVGKIKESVLKRTVLKGIGKRNSEISSGNCSCDFASVVSADGDIVFASDEMAGDADILPALVIHAAVNKLYAKGARPLGLILNIILPEKKREIALKCLMENAEKTCEEIGISIAGGHTSVSDAVNRTVFAAVSFGSLTTIFKKHQSVPVGFQLVMTKWAAIEGTVIIMEKKGAGLSERFNSDFMTETGKLSACLSLKKEAEIFCSFPECIVRPVRTGGIFTALWDMGEMTGAGVRAYLKDIPLRQESIEILNHLDLNPYYMTSGGAALIATADAEEMCEKFREAGVEASIIGELTAGNERIVVNSDRVEYLKYVQPEMTEGNNNTEEPNSEELEVRYLEPYKADEINKV